MSLGLHEHLAWLQWLHIVSLCLPSSDGLEFVARVLYLLVFICTICWNQELLELRNRND